MESRMKKSCVPNLCLAQMVRSPSATALTPKLTHTGPTGAHSWVRKTFDITMDGEQTGENMLSDYQML